MEVKDIYIKKGNDYNTVDFWVKGNNEMFSYDMFDEIKHTQINEEEFIPLFDFIRQAKYVGKEFRRTSARLIPYAKGSTSQKIYIVKKGKLLNTARRYTKDESYMNPSDLFRTYVMYEKDGIMLVKKIYRGQPRYEFMESCYLKDGNYELYGNIEESKEDTLLNIMNQIQERETRNKRQVRRIV